MAIREFTIEIPARTETRSRKLCDLCGAEADPSGAWESDAWKRTEVTVELKTIESYPETGSSEALAWDFCPPCFRTKVMPALEAISKARTEEVNW